MPGIQPADIRELIEHGAKTVVLSKGIWERLQVCPETLEVLAENGIEVEVLQTEMAVERFNNLREGVPDYSIPPAEKPSVGFAGRTCTACAL